MLAAIILMVCSLGLASAATADCPACENDPEPCCDLYTKMSIWEVEKMASFCYHGRRCYVINEHNYEWLKCTGYCELSRTYPAPWSFDYQCKIEQDDLCCRPAAYRYQCVRVVCCYDPSCSTTAEAKTAPLDKPTCTLYEDRTLVSDKYCIDTIEDASRAGVTYMAFKVPTKCACQPSIG